jgi:hypothetical protein
LAEVQPHLLFEGRDEVAVLDVTQAWQLR